MDAKELLRQARRTPVQLVPGKSVVSPVPGEWPSPFEGKGFEPRGFRDFVLGDNPRHIHLPTSARRGTPTIIERVALRDVKVMVLLDLSASMQLRDKRQAQVTCAAIVLYWAWKSETTFGLGVRAGDKVETLGLGIGSRHFFRVFNQLTAILGGGRGAKAGSRVPLAEVLPSNAILLYCSDFLDQEGEVVQLQSLLKTMRRYDLVPVIVQDALEYSFPDVPAGTFLTFVNPETKFSKEIWISPTRAGQIRAVHAERFRGLTDDLGRRGLRSIHLEATDAAEIGKRLARFFRQRKKR